MERIFGSLDRRTFLGAGGAFALSLGGLSTLGADAQSGSGLSERTTAMLDPRRALKPLAVNRVTVKVGAAKSFKVMHVSDTHFTFCDVRDDARKQKLAASRIKGMRRGEHYLDEAFRLAADEGAVLMHTGDLIDFTSKANYDAVVEHFAGSAPATTSSFRTSGKPTRRTPPTRRSRTPPHRRTFPTTLPSPPES